MYSQKLKTRLVINNIKKIFSEIAQMHEENTHYKEKNIKKGIKNIILSLKGECLHFMAFLNKQ
jgi:hypothetical protein